MRSYERLRRFVTGVLFINGVRNAAAAAPIDQPMAVKMARNTI